MKRALIIIVLVSLVSVLVYQNFLKTPETAYQTFEVKKGRVVEEISETGQVKRGERISLGFESGGVIEEIFIKTGEEVEEGQVLARLGTGQLGIQLEEAQANSNLAQAELDKLLAGATQEEIQLVRTEVDNAQTALQSVQQSLEDIKTKGEQDLRAAYEDSINYLDDSYLKIFNSFNVVDLLQSTYFTTNDQPGVKVRESGNDIQESLEEIEPYLDQAKLSEGQEDTDEALSEMEASLKVVSESLKTVRENCNRPYYKSLISSTHLTSLDTQRGYINTALSNITDAQQNISSVKISNQRNINAAQGEVNSASGYLRAAQDKLDKIAAPPRKEDIELSRAKIEQAQAKVRLIQKQITDSVLRSPVKGQIAEIAKEEGEITQAALQNPVFILIPSSPFEIEVDIYEEDVAKINIGNPVDISLIAFPREKIKGKVISVDPSENLIDGVVYYRVIIMGSDFPEGTKPGMTSDLVITAEVKENVIVIPGRAVWKKENGTATIRVLEEGEVKEKEVSLGLEGSNDFVEIKSGLKTGEKVLIE